MADVSRYFMRQLNRRVKEEEEGGGKGGGFVGLWNGLRRKSGSSGREGEGEGEKGGEEGRGEERSVQNIQYTREERNDEVMNSDVNRNKSEK